MIRITKLANELGVTRQAVYRAMKKLELPAEASRASGSNVISLNDEEADMIRDYFDEKNGNIDIQGLDIIRTDMDKMSTKADGMSTKKDKNGQSEDNTVQTPVNFGQIHSRIELKRLINQQKEKISLQNQIISSLEKKISVHEETADKLEQLNSILQLQLDNIKSKNADMEKYKDDIINRIEAENAYLKGLLSEKDRELQAVNERVYEMSLNASRIADQQQQLALASMESKKKGLLARLRNKDTD